MSILKYFKSWTISLNAISAALIVFEAQMGIIRDITPDQYEPYLLLVYVLLNVALRIRTNKPLTDYTK